MNNQKQLPIGALLKYWRCAAGKTQDEMAIMFGAKRAQYSTWETGRHTPSIQYVYAFTESIGITMSDFFAPTEIINKLRSGL